MRGKLTLHSQGEVLLQKIDHNLPKQSGLQAPSLLHRITSILDNRDNGRVGARSPDSLFFEQVDQPSLAVAPRRLGEFLRAFELFQQEFHSLAKTAGEHRLLRTLLGEQGKEAIKRKRASSSLKCVHASGDQRLAQ